MESSIDPTKQQNFKKIRRSPEYEQENEPEFDTERQKVSIRYPPISDSNAKYNRQGSDKTDKDGFVFSFCQNSVNRDSPSLSQCVKEQSIKTARFFGQSSDKIELPINSIDAGMNQNIEMAKFKNDPNNNKDKNLLANPQINFKSSFQASSLEIPDLKSVDSSQF